MAVQYNQQQIMTNYPTTYESFWTKQILVELYSQSITMWILKLHENDKVP